MAGRDQPPAIRIAPIGRAKTGTAVTLSAAVTDDGLPAPSKPRPPRPLEPTLRGAPPSPVNVPLPARPRPAQGLSVLWMVYRGPAAVAFDPDGYAKVADGKAAPSRPTACSGHPPTSP